MSFGSMLELIISTESEAHTDEVLESTNHIQEKKKKTQIVFFSILQLKDSHQLNAKVSTSCILNQALFVSDFDSVDNSNALFHN